MPTSFVGIVVFPDRTDTLQIYKRYQQLGIDGLQEHSRRPHSTLKVRKSFAFVIIIPLIIFRVRGNRMTGNV